MLCTTAHTGLLLLMCVCALCCVYMFSCLLCIPSPSYSHWLCSGLTLSRVDSLRYLLYSMGIDTQLLYVRVAYVCMNTAAGVLLIHIVHVCFASLLLHVFDVLLLFCLTHTLALSLISTHKFGYRFHCIVVCICINDILSSQSHAKKLFLRTSAYARVSLCV